MGLQTPAWIVSTALMMTVAVTGVAFSAPVPKLDCIIEPHMMTDISSQVEGIVESIEVERGDLIEKNQVLVQLASGVEKATVDYARVRAAATSEVRANETGAGLQPVQASEHRELARLNLVRAIENLKRHTIVSPINGVVVERFLSLGESVEEKPILRLAQIDPLRVEVIVPILHINDISVGQKAIVFPEEPIKGTYSATVTIVDRVADSATGTFRVRLALPNPDYVVPAGLRCHIRFLAREPAATTIAGQSSRRAGISVPAVARVDDVRILSVLLGGDSPGETVGKRPRPEVAKKNSQNACATLGPIDTAERAEALHAHIAPEVRQARLRQARGKDTKDYMILTPAAENIEEALALAKAIRQAGLEDVSVVRRGKNALRVSIGIYTGKTGADRHRDRGAALGFETEVVPRMRQTKSFWLDIDSGPDNALATLLADIAPDVESTVEQCDRFVVADEP